jgi:putative membrane protein
VSKSQNQIAWVSIFVVVLIWSGIRPYEYGTWMLEVVPALIGGVVLWLTRKSFPLTPIAYVLILIHCVILMIGGHYTYAEVPLFNWLQDAYDLSRNNYDKVGHFAQGFIPAIVAREIVIRKNVFNSVAWRNFFIVCFCLGFSAFYELIEWWVALLSEDAADSFLGTQGYIWDTQSDMWWALCGALLALSVLGRWHDRQIASLQTPTA